MEEVEELWVGTGDGELEVHRRATGVSELAKRKRVSKRRGVLSGRRRLYSPVLSTTTRRVANNKPVVSIHLGTSTYGTMCLHRNSLKECSFNLHSVQHLPSVGVVFRAEQRNTLLVC